MPNFGDTNRGAIHYIEEVTEGTTPASDLKEFRTTGEGIAPNYEHVISEEIRSDRQISDLINVGYDAGGNLDAEVSFGTPDNFLEGALGNTWGTTVAISATDISAANADNSYNSVSTDFVALGIEVGMVMPVAGFTDSSNNGWVRVLSVAANKIVVDGLTLADEVAGDTVTMKGAILKNGTEKKSYSIEKHFSDLDTPEFHIFRGMRVSTFQLSLSPRSVLTCSFNFMGLSSDVGTSSYGSGSFTAAGTADVMNASGNVAVLKEGGQLMSSGKIYPTNIELNIDNGLRAQSGIGQAGNIGTGDGTMNVSGSLTSYYVDSTTYDKMRNGTATSLQMIVTDGSGNSYAVDMPKVKFKGGAPGFPSGNSDVELALEFQALRDETLGYTISITRISA